jgi:NTP pyrophosphatase (non-canonical NTP hydrolase)
MSMTFTEFSEINRLRCESPQGFNHPIDSWSLSDWMVAASGELGEAANFVKKLNRVKDGVVGNTESEGELRLGLAKEIADTVAYLDLLAQSQGWDLGTIVQSKFEEVSERIGYMSPPPQEKEPTGFLSIYSNQSVVFISRSTVV